MVRAPESRQKIRAQDTCKGVNDISQVRGELANPDDLHTHAHKTGSEQHQESAISREAIDYFVIYSRWRAVRS